MKPLYRHLKLNFLVKIECRDGAWHASSESLGVTAHDQTPEGAVERLQKNLQEAENKVANKAKAEKADGQKAEAKPSEEAEQSTASEESADAGEDSSTGEGEPEPSGGTLQQKIQTGNITELRDIAVELGVSSEGLTKVPLREALLEKLDEDETSFEE